MVSHSCAEWTEIARPLTSVPIVEFSNMLACRTIDQHPGFFTVETPINVDKFENLLGNHPNPLFMQSVIKGLWNGFWPWADTHLGEYPDTWVESIPDPKIRKSLISSVHSETKKSQQDIFWLDLERNSYWECIACRYMLYPSHTPQIFTWSPTIALETTL